MAILNNKITLSEAVQQCRGQSKQYKKIFEIDYCLIVFLYAIVENEDVAWQFLQTQYKQLIFYWAQRVANHTDYIDDDLAHDVFVRFWQVLQKDRTQFEERFTNTSAVMGYLNRCTVSILQERKRKHLSQLRRQNALIKEQPVAVYEFEKREEHRLDKERRLLTVREWIQYQVTDEKELLILTLMYEQGLTPKKIVAQYPEDFPTIKQLRQVRDRVLKRARRTLLETT